VILSRSSASPNEIERGERPHDGSLKGPREPDEARAFVPGLSLCVPGDVASDITTKALCDPDRKKLMTPEGVFRQGLTEPLPFGFEIGGDRRVIPTSNGPVVKASPDVLRHDHDEVKVNLSVLVPLDHGKPLRIAFGQLAGQKAVHAAGRFYDGSNIVGECKSEEA
jgi:hypothetical protein